MKKILTFIDTNILAILAGCLLAFIPLYPKIPLFDILPGYIVRVRAEDFLVGFSILVFLSQILRKRVKLEKNVPTVGLLSYLAIGLLSVIVAVLVVQTVPMELKHVGKTLLHWMRRIEYFSLFFIVFGSIKSLRTAKVLVWIFFIVLLLITLYGYGQKYFAYPYFPAFSTMNREFSKGWVLYLTQNARVLSTFGGHYDLAGYLVIALSLGWSFFFGAKRRLVKVAFGLIILAAFWLLILTASRASFLGYLAAVVAVCFIWMFKRDFMWALSRCLAVICLSILLMLSFGDLSDRFLHLLHLEERVTGLREIVLRPMSAPPPGQTLLENNSIAAVTSKTDMPPTPADKYFDEVKKQSLPADVNKDAPPLMIPTKTASGSTVMVEKTRTYSQNAVLFDLSTGIRFDSTWPRAIEGFKASPLFGSGYATLTKSTKYEFSEAESTDNGFLRSLGETGLLGFLAYFGTLIAMVVVVIKSLGGIKDTFIYSLAAAFVAFTMGLLVNAVMLDIFEASKVAYVYFGMAGLTMGTIYLFKKKITEDYEPLKINFAILPFLKWLWRFVRSDFFLLGIVVVCSFQLRTYRLSEPLADWHSWRQADTSAVTRDFDRNGRIDWLYPTFEDLSSIPSGLPNPRGLRMVEFPIYNAASVTVKKIFKELSVEEAGRVTTNLMWSGSVIFLFLLTRRYLSRRIAYCVAISMAVIPFGIFYGRSILPDPTMVTFSLGAQWAMSRYLEKKKIASLFLSLVFAAVALLVKPFAIFLLLPIAYLWWVANRFNLKKWLVLAVFFGIAAAPMLWWRHWISQFPEGIPASDWLFNGDSIRFKGAFFYWLFADRIGRLILGHWGLILLGFGLIRNYEGKARFYSLVLFLSSLLWLCVFATGNVRHDYYQILLMPSLALLVGGGVELLLFSKIAGLNTYLSKGLGTVAFVFMCAFGWYFVKDFFNVNHPELALAGKAVREVANDRSLVVAPYSGDTAFLYQTERKGWPIIEGTIQDMVAKGADYYVSVNYDDPTKALMQEALGNNNVHEYKILVTEPEYVIIQLVPDRLLPK